LLKGSKYLNKLNDSELIEAVKAGKTEAYNELIKRHSPAVFGICLAILGNVHDAEQVFSSVMAVGKARISEIEQDSSFRAWISNLACQMCEDLFERKNIEKTFTKPLSDLDKYEDIIGRKPADIARLQQGLKKLDMESRLALVLFYFTGHNSRHLAQSLAICPEQARRIIRHARGQLRQIMKQLN
jgi:RNA polymerase sigma-70 factor, ECF subfamily